MNKWEWNDPPLSSRCSELRQKVQQDKDIPELQEQLLDFLEGI